MKSTDQTQDLVIIGGGIMGLMTAYYASAFTPRVVILEKRTIGNKQAASFSFTRSMRTDYLDPFYARLAYEAQGLWRELQARSEDALLVSCGCLNLVKASITPDVDETYAAKSYRVLQGVGFGPERYGSKSLRERFPQFSADAGFLDTNGGYFRLPAITALLRRSLCERGVTIIENTEPQNIVDDGKRVRITTASDEIVAKKAVVTSGMWVNDVLRRVEGTAFEAPISLDRPKECKYYYPAPGRRAEFSPARFPVFAYLDVGIYGHPIFDEAKGALKISYYNPTDMETRPNSKITCVADFVRECLPELQDARSEDVTDADQCSYDLVADDEFIVGALPKQSNIILGAGWRGTGYKFAPWIGKTLTQLALQNGTVYDIKRFNPGRFAQ